MIKMIHGTCVEIQLPSGTRLYVELTADTMDVTDQDGRVYLSEESNSGQWKLLSPLPGSMRAYPDSKCSFGYMCVCRYCLPNVPAGVNKDSPINNPPAMNKTQPCELCKQEFILF